jgi:hypothetical protein
VADLTGSFSPAPLPECAAPLWAGQSVSDAQPLHVLAPGHARDIAAAVRVLTSAISGRDLRRDQNLSPADLPVPHLDQMLAQISRQVCGWPGFGVLRGLPVDDLDDAQCLVLLRALAARLGRIATQSRHADLIRDVQATGHDLGDGLTRGHQTAERLWFHTDGADAAVLLCRRGAASGGLSRVASAATVHNRMLARAPSAVARLYQDHHFHMAGGNTPGCPPTFVSAIFALHGGRFSCRYVRHTLLETAHLMGVALPRGTVEAFDLLETMAGQSALDMRLQPGDLQVVNNHTVLHSRTAYTDPPARPGTGRHLLRAWVTLTTLPDPRPGAVDRGLRGGWLSDDLQREVATTWRPPVAADTRQVVR